MQLIEKIKRSCIKVASSHCVRTYEPEHIPGAYDYDIPQEGLLI